MNAPITGIHHVTAIATDPQVNIDFYAGLLGLRLVKKTVNFDDPSAYHLYYGDESGTPGSIITFFYWPGAHARSRGFGSDHRDHVFRPGRRRSISGPGGSRSIASPRPVGRSSARTCSPSPIPTGFPL
ncbi:MAG: VOC family protein [Nibricoccus sp.]